MLCYAPAIFLLASVVSAQKPDDPHYLPPDANFKCQKDYGKKSADGKWNYCVPGGDYAFQPVPCPGTDADLGTDCLVFFPVTGEQDIDDFLKSGKPQCLASEDPYKAVSPTGFDVSCVS